jgi:hypothetical protein
VAGQQVVEAFGDLDEHRVTRAVPAGVVDGLELVQVGEQDRHLVWIGSGESRGETFTEESAVGEPGQRVGVRLSAQLLLHSAAGSLASVQPPRGGCRQQREQRSRADPCGHAELPAVTRLCLLAGGRELQLLERYVHALAVLGLELGIAAAGDRGVGAVAIAGGQLAEALLLQRDECLVGAVGGVHGAVGCRVGRNRQGLADDAVEFGDRVVVALDVGDVAAGGREPGRHRQELVVVADLLDVAGQLGPGVRGPVCGPLACHADELHPQQRPEQGDEQQRKAGRGVRPHPQVVGRPTPAVDSLDGCYPLAATRSEGCRLRLRSCSDDAGRRTSLVPPSQCSPV